LTQPPLVSIVLPTFNRLRYLRPAVDSVLAQTLGDWELIVADDGSEGETARYLAALADLPRIRIMRLPHTGNVPAVRNAACHEARGEYIAFLDSDDVWSPEKLALQVGSLRAHPQRGWSHTAFAVIDEQGERLAGARARSWPATEGWVLERLVRMDTIIAISSVVLRRRLLEQLGGFDAAMRVCEDYDLWLRLAASSELDGVRETLLFKRDHRVPDWYNHLMVLEHLSRSLEKLLAANTQRAVHPLAHRERAKLAAALALNQAAAGCRRAALRTLASSAHYSLGYPEWWRGGIGAAARALAPASTVRIARLLLGRGRAI
jgi:glycosyltransferase involved in cell wall biosynthesis